MTHRSASLGRAVTVPGAAHPHTAATGDTRQFLALTDGATHWLREGPAHAEPVVLIHGATVPSWEFDLLVPLLLRSGFQTLRFDLYGHGESDRPRCHHSIELFMRQVMEVMEKSGFPRPAMLLGHSFGAALAAAVAAARPEWISRLVLVAPMLDFSSSSPWTTLFRWPGVGEMAMHFLGMPALIRRRRKRYEHIGQPHLTARFIEQVRYGGFARALLSMFRTGALGDQSRRYAALTMLHREILVITGERDSIIPAEHVSQVRSLLPSHEHVCLPAEHKLLLTHAEQLTDALLRWRRSRLLDRWPLESMTVHPRV